MEKKMKSGKCFAEVGRNHRIFEVFGLFPPSRGPPVAIWKNFLSLLPSEHLLHIVLVTWSRSASVGFEFMRCARRGPQVVRIVMVIGTDRK